MEPIWTLTLINLRDVLAALYPTVPDAVMVAQEAGLNSSYIDLSGKAINNWHNILTEAHHQRLVEKIIEIARKRFPRHEWLAQAAQGHLDAVRGPAIGEEIPWEGPEEGDELEKILGAQSTLVSISFLEVGMQRARSVGRIVTPDGLGTGFLIANNLLITNHHVLPHSEVAQQVVVQFNYQTNAEGLAQPYEEYKLLPEEVFATSKAHDWTAVRVAGQPVDRWGALELATANPKKEDRVNIIQHAGGGPKQLALYHNVVAYVGHDRVQYLTDTQPGSSGSPVFDHAWHIVALHHSGGWLLEPGSKNRYYRNEGIHINAVIAGLQAAGLL